MELATASARSSSRSTTSTVVDLDEERAEAVASSISSGGGERVGTGFADPRSRPGNDCRATIELVVGHLTSLCPPDCPGALQQATTPWPRVRTRAICILFGCLRPFYPGGLVCTRVMNEASEVVAGAVRFAPK